MQFDLSDSLIRYSTFLWTMVNTRRASKSLTDFGSVLPKAGEGADSTTTALGQRAMHRHRLQSSMLQEISGRSLGTSFLFSGRIEP
jgi:hypothetical protein